MPIGDRAVSNDPSFAPCVSCEIITESERFLALRPEWDALWARAASPRLSQGFAWCLAGWRTTAMPRGRRLFIVVMRDGARTVLIWPMTLRRRLAWRVAGALGPEGSEYDPVLVEAGPQAVAHLAAAWSVVREASRAAVVTIPYVRRDTDMHRMLAARRLRRTTRTLPCPYVGWDGIASWEAYWRARGSKFCREMARRRRRLAERGEVAWQAIDAPAALQEVVAWTLAAKLGWLARKQVFNDFLPTPEFRAFLLAVAATPAATGRLMAFALRLDGRLIATQIAARDGAACEAMIMAHDPAFAAYGPGQILLADALEWCHARGLTYDFRIGDEAYKHAWANGDCPATTQHIAVTRWGALLLAADAARLWWRRAKRRLRRPHVAAP